MTRTKPLASVARARKLRRAMTPPEVHLWQHLRAKPEGIRFRRQHPLGPYVLDFYCAEAKLAVELDGITHDMGDNPERDERRDTWLTGQGLAVIRIAAQEVLDDPSAFADSLVRMVIARR